MERREVDKTIIEDSGLVSVIMPAFNAEASISSSIESVLKQTFTNFELIIVNDSSTDGTLTTAANLAAKDNRMTVVSLPRNSGVGAARNYGLTFATGKFVAMIDADDLWHPTKLSKQVERLEAAGDQYALVYTGARYIDAAGNILPSREPYYVEGNIANQLMYRNFIYNSSIVFRREALVELGGYTEVQKLQGCADFLLSVTLASRYKITCVQEYLLGYRITEYAMSSNFSAMCKARMLAVDILCESLEGLTDSSVKQGATQIRVTAALENIVSLSNISEGITGFVRVVKDDASGTIEVLFRKILRLKYTLFSTLPPKHFYEIESTTPFKEIANSKLTYRRFALGKIADDSV